MDISSIDIRGGRLRVNHLKVTVVNRRPVPQFELALQPMRLAPERFRPITTWPFQIQAAHLAITHDKGMGFSTLINRHHAAADERGLGRRAQAVLRLTTGACGSIPCDLQTRRPME